MQPLANIGIIGSGVVGQTLAKAFQSERYSVMISARDKNKPELTDFTAANAGIQAGSFADAAAFGEILVLATAGDAAESALQLAGAAQLAGKIIIDATNPIAKQPPVNGVLSYFTDINYSLMEVLQKAFPEAKLVKAFNSVGSAFMYKPDFAGGKPTMFIAGNDAAAKATVTDILSAFGWETADMGAAEAARAIEPLAMLWCIPGFTKNQWSHAFKLLVK
jgi:predicted dinucleotide-binding enzyme